MEKKNETILTVKAPSRIDISSGAADWCGFCTLSIAINLYTEVIIKKRNDNLIGIKFAGKNESYDIKNPIKKDDDLDFIKYVIDEASVDGYDLEISTEIPRQSGLGGSGSISIAILYAIQKLFGLNWNKYYLAEKAQRIETNRLKTLQGYQDQYTPTFGGLLLMDFKYKSSKAIDEEPFTTVEQLAEYNDAFKYILIVDFGVIHSSGERNDTLQQKYQSGDKETVGLMNRLDLLGRLTKQAIVNNDSKKIWDYINENQKIMVKFGRSDDLHNDVIELALKSGAKAAKCTGAGNAALAFFCDSENSQKNVYNELRKNDNIKNIYFVKMSEGVKTY